jgi:hypothetical protein
MTCTYTLGVLLVIATSWHSTMGFGNISCGVFSKIEKDNDLASFISMSKVGYAKPLTFMWDVRNFATKSSGCETCRKI